MSFLNFRTDSSLKYKARSYTYMPVLARTVRPVDLIDLKSHLKIDYTEESQENYLNFLIDAATDRAERFTNRSFINQKWKTFRDFVTAFITLERGTYGVLNTFKYYNTAGVLTVVDPTSYYVAIKDPYSQIIMVDDSESYPSDIIDRQNSIEIEFTCGYGATKESVPAMLRLLICQHVTWLYENKGNCSVDELPAIVLDGYKKFRVADINASTYL